MTRLINDDLISRQAAIDALGERPMVWTDSDYEIAQRNQYDMDKLAIETVPSAQPDAVPVVHGRWDKCTDSYWHICEECGAEVDISMGTGVWVEGVELHELKYCPNCGSRNRSEE